MATPQHTPHGRGYEHSLVYFHHVNDAWSFIPFSEKSCMGQNVRDLWENEGTATLTINFWTISPTIRVQWSLYSPC